MATPEEKAALEWLDQWSRPVSDPDGTMVATLKAMLAEPRLPEEATPEMQSVMFRAYREGEGVTLWSQVYRALYAHLTKPKEPRWSLETHYVGAASPTVVTFDTAAEAFDAAAHRHKCHAGVSHTIIRQVSP